MRASRDPDGTADAGSGDPSATINGESRQRAQVVDHHRPARSWCNDISSISSGVDCSHRPDGAQRLPPPGGRVARRERPVAVLTHVRVSAL